MNIKIKIHAHIPFFETDTKFKIQGIVKNIF